MEKGQLRLEPVSLGLKNREKRVPGTNWAQVFERHVSLLQGSTGLNKRQNTPGLSKAPILFKDPHSLRQNVPVNQEPITRYCLTGAKGPYLSSEVPTMGAWVLKTTP